MKILIIIILTFIFKSSLSLSEEIKMMECRVDKTMFNCSSTDTDCEQYSDTESHKNSSYNLLKYVKRIEGDEIYYRDEGKWNIFKGLADPPYKKEILNYTGYYKYVVNSGRQIFEFWFDFFYPSKKMTHLVVSFIDTKNQSPYIYNYKCRKYKN